eukprot:CAMPEP_0178982986 /NCGR_PEP_ID=MMETSP0795-20121207/798_1 /TAXON_ID=88552 /ORGANISM="Amoebophrya sp., Strain Ameob2" /LENGTH=104 /DNA_ID=CAMNT_0020673687 /DNA_START=297 /DNA_END=608 /DNA_ORIENTATION=-
MAEHSTGDAAHLRQFGVPYPPQRLPVLETSLHFRNRLNAEASAPRVWKDAVQNLLLLRHMELLLDVGQMLLPRATPRQNHDAAHGGDGGGLWGLGRVSLHPTCV